MDLAMEGFTMPYWYKLGNDGSLLPEVPDEVKIKKEEFKKGGLERVRISSKGYLRKY